MNGVLAGARLRHLRADRGLSQVEMARRLELSPSYLNQLEHNRRPLTVPVLLRLAEAFGVDATFFSAQDGSRLVAELRDTLADDTIGLDMSPAQLAELVDNYPDFARALIELRRRYRDTVAHTSALVGGQGLQSGDEMLVSMPHEQVRDFFYDRQNYVDPLDQAAEALAGELELRPGADARVGLVKRLRERHDVRVVSELPEASGDELRRYDADAHVLRLSGQLRHGQQAFQLATQLAFLEHEPLLEEIAESGSFTSSETRALARIGLAHYYAGALLMPYGRFLAAAEELRYDIERLGDRFGVGFEVICHRLSTLQRAGQRGVPFSFIRVDRAGNISKRQSATGFHFSRGGGSCPLWNVYEAFTTPGRILTQVAQMPDGRSYFWVARTVSHQRSGFGMPTKTYALGLGCELRDAHRLVYSRGLDLKDPTLATPIGMGCKTCERTQCPQRAFPAVNQHLRVDPDRTSFTPYPVLEEG
jgi:predicted transcriptional regulator/transcriptional regulator with XRE-family HTH domain